MWGWQPVNTDPLPTTEQSQQTYDKIVATLREPFRLGEVDLDSSNDDDDDNDDDYDDPSFIVARDLSIDSVVSYCTGKIDDEQLFARAVKGSWLRIRLFYKFKFAHPSSLFPTYI
jgi:hypothetical protein